MCHTIEDKLGVRAQLIDDKDINGLTYKQIAELYNIPIGTVKSRIHRGRKIIKNMEDNE